MQNARFVVIPFLLLFSFLLPAVPASAARRPSPDIEKLRREIAELHKSNQALRSELETLRASQADLETRLNQAVVAPPAPAPVPEPVAPPPLTDLERALQDAIAGVPPVGEDVKTAPQATLGMGGATNPDMGVVGIFTYTAGRRNAAEGGSPYANTFKFEEAEFLVSGFVDPFHKYDLVLGFHDDEVHVCEAFLTKFDLPHNLGARFGIWRSSLGFINPHHRCELPWAGHHLFSESFLGEYGLTTTGLELKRTLRTAGDWTPTLTFELGSGVDHDRNDPGSDPNPLNPWHTRTHAADRRVLARLRNHFDVGARRELALGFSYLRADRGALDILGVDFQFRTRPRAYRGWTILAEYMKRRDDAFNLARRAAGFSGKSPEGGLLNIEYQWHPQWKAGVVLSEFDATHRVESGNTRSRLAYLTHYITEFSRYLLQVEERDVPGFPQDQRATLQLIFNTGFHRHRLK